MNVQASEWAKLSNASDLLLCEQAFNLTEDQAITAITVGVDFGVTQVRGALLSVTLCSCGVLW